MSRTIRVCVAVGLVLALALGAGCQQIAEKAAQSAVEKATGVKVDERGDKVTVTGKDGKSATFSGGDGKLPENLPADFPVYEGTPEGGGAVEANDGKTWTFTIVTADPVKTAFDWYKTELKAQQWTIESSATASFQGSETGSLSAKKDTKEAVITIGSDTSKGDKTSIMVILSEKPK